MYTERHVDRYSDKVPSKKQKAKVAVSSGWLSVCMLLELGDVGDTDIHKQQGAAMMEMRACIHNLT